MSPPTVTVVIGWLADFFRFVWALLYWNTRKSWFQLGGRRGRSPCQNPSDSGRAFETQCEACLQWDRPARFARVCPLLVATPQGLRCSVDTPRVRPFWGRVLRYVGGSLLGLYLIGAIGIFVFLRTIGYPISIFHVTWPGLWYRVPQARSAYFFEQGNKAFAAGHVRQGLLYFENAYKFDPGNYLAGLALARNYQTTQPIISDAVYRRLYREHPGQRAATAQDWFRALLARGDFTQVAFLAAHELVTNSLHASPWMRALIFATRQTHDDQTLQTLLAGTDIHVKPWHTLLETELLLRADKTTAARVNLLRPWPLNSPPYALYYQVENLLASGENYPAFDQLGRSVGHLDDETVLALRLAAYARAGLKSQLAFEFNTLLSRPLTPPAIKILSAHLIRYPDPALFQLFYAKFERAALPLTTENAGSHFSVLCVAGVHQDRARLEDQIRRLKSLAAVSFLRLNLVADFFNNESAALRIATFLPILPVPLEVTYALLERYPGPSSRPATAAPRTP
ncbi:MAG: hypothetical protein H7343_13460 [Undibacterium sp.]|nr:hypothetical protein [Opitutaceae bacterium]